MKHDIPEMKDYAEDIDALLVFVRLPLYLIACTEYHDYDH